MQLDRTSFGVNLLGVVTRAVKTNGQTYFGNFKLPDQSLYKGIKGVIASRA